MYEKGLAGMRYSISNTAEYGDMTRGPSVITDETREAMKKILAEIQSGEFAREWIAENRAGRRELRSHARRGQGQADRAGRRRPPVDDGLDRRLTSKPHPGGKKQAVGRTAGMAALTVGALGVVFGDIGTSPLYALQTVFHADHGAVEATPGDVFGVISLVFWAMTIIVSIKYVTLIMRADNEGEGGIMALIALIQNAPPRRAVHEDRAGRARHLRRVALLRRRHDHAGHLGALGGRGPRGRRAGARARSSCRSRSSILRRPVRDPAVRHGPRRRASSAR